MLLLCYIGNVNYRFTANCSQVIYNFSRRAPKIRFERRKLGECTPLAFTRMSTTNTSLPNSSALVTPSWLAQHSNEVTILDASWHMPKLNRDSDLEFRQSRIRGARRFDIDGEYLCDKRSSLPHMLPATPEQFARGISKMGIRSERPVVVYATNGFVGAARAWWMFRVYGKNNVYVLDGGISSWQAQGFPTISGDLDSGDSNSPGRADELFIPTYNSTLVTSLSDILQTIEKRNGLIIDARSAGRFYGTSPEPRPGLLSGHMPGAYNISSDKVLNGDGTLKARKDLEQVISDSLKLQIDDLKKHKISLTCGSGVTAAILALALHEIGIDSAVYDGSWSEYGSINTHPVTT